MTDDFGRDCCSPVVVAVRIVGVAGRIRDAAAAGAALGVAGAASGSRGRRQRPFDMD